MNSRRSPAVRGSRASGGVPGGSACRPCAGPRRAAAPSASSSTPERSARVETTTKTSTQHDDAADAAGPGHDCGQRSPTAAASTPGADSQTTSASSDSPHSSTSSRR